MTSKMHDSWQPIKNLLYQEPMSSFNQKLGGISFQPKSQDIFNVFQMPLKDIKVVILGQDPYPIPGDAIGYAFATSMNKKMPTSLRNIKQEIDNTQGLDRYSEYDEWQTLRHWREQGVFLLNTALTVQTSRAGSHLKNWKPFTQSLVRFISGQRGVIWILWGRKAQIYSSNIARKFDVLQYTREEMEHIPAVREYNYVIQAPHPAAEAYAGGNAGFFGSDCFYVANRVLKNLKQPVIYW